MLFVYTIIYNKTKIIYNVPKRTGPNVPKRTGPNVPKRTFQKKERRKNENTKNNLKIKDR